MLVAHAPLASAFARLAMHMHGEEPAALLPVDGTAGADQSIVQQALVDLRGTGAQRLLLLVDLPGAKPCNLARHIAAQAGVPSCIVAGLSAAMLLAALGRRDGESLARLAAAVRQRGRVAICPVARAKPA